VIGSTPAGGTAPDRDLPRCWWPDGVDRVEPSYVVYHDTEWGVRVEDDAELFERLALESFQAGLAWVTILRKRDAFRSAFRGFDPAVVARFGPAERERLMADAGIVRNAAKIDAVIGNAAGSLGLIEEFGGLAPYFDRFVEHPVRRQPPGATMADLPVSTPAAGALSADLRRRGFRFVGPTIVYAFMQSVGLVDDHLPGCFRYAGG
jgi:DNA-3-methyladenine glycosylase I